MNTPTSTTAAHRAARHPSGDNVDIVDTRPTPPPVAAVTRGRPGGMSVPRPMPIPTKLSRPPQPVVGDGPSGPDAGRVRSLHETRRRALKAKAETAGAMPGTGSVGRHGGITRASSTQDQYLARGRILLNR